MELVAVTSALPAALPEEVPSPDNTQTAEGRALRWADGCWLWSLGRWVWDRGGWYAVTSEHAYFRGKVYYAPTGQIFLRPCTWLLAGRPADPPELVIPAKSPTAPRTVHELH